MMHSLQLPFLVSFFSCFYSVLKLFMYACCQLIRRHIVPFSFFNLIWIVLPFKADRSICSEIVHYPPIHNQVWSGTCQVWVIALLCCQEVGWWTELWISFENKLVSQCTVQSWFWHCENALLLSDNSRRISIGDNCSVMVCDSFECQSLSGSPCCLFAWCIKISIYLSFFHLSLFFWIVLPLITTISERLKNSVGGTLYQLNLE